MSQPAKIHSYSPFWPLQITITCVAAWVAFQLFLINTQRLTLDGRLDDIENQIQSADESVNRMMALQQDLLTLAQRGDPNAQAIIKKHNLFVLGHGGNPGALANPENSPPPGPEGQYPTH